MERICLAFPCKPDKSVDDIKSIADMFMDRPDEYRESRKRLGITLERVYLQPTHMGNFVLAYGESGGPSAGIVAGIVHYDLSIDKEFVRLVDENHGVDLTVPPPGPPPETVGQFVDPDVTERKKGFAFCAPGRQGSEAEGRAFAKEAYQ